MKDDSLSDVHKPRLIYADSSSKCITSEGVVLDSVGKQENVYAKQIWNDAIEAAAKRIEALDDWFPVTEIRKLKK